MQPNPSSSTTSSASTIYVDTEVTKGGTEPANEANNVTTELEIVTSSIVNALGKQDQVNEDAMKESYETVFSIPKIENVQAKMEESKETTILAESKETIILVESIVDPQMPNSAEDLIVQTTTKESHGSSEEQTIILVDSHADPTVVVLDIDFIIGNERWTTKDCDLVIQFCIQSINCIRPLVAVTPTIRF